MHPLVSNLTNLADDELHSKLAELNKRFNQAYRFGPQQIIPQLQMLIQDYTAEVARRNAVKMQEMQEKFDVMTQKKNGRGLKDIIDV